MGIFGVFSLYLLLRDNFDFENVVVALVVKALRVFDRSIKKPV